MDGNERKAQQDRFKRRGGGRGSAPRMRGSLPFQQTFQTLEGASSTIRSSNTGNFGKVLPLQQSSANRQTRQAPANQRGFGFSRLHALSKQPGLQIMEILASKNTMAEFVALANQTDLKDDFVVRIVIILGKLSRTEFDEIVIQLLHQISTTCFLNQLLCYIVKYQDEEPEESAYQYVFDFFDNCAAFCHTVTKRLPTLACEKLSPIVKQCNIFLATSYFDGIDGVKEIMNTVMEKLTIEKDKRKKEPVKKSSEEELMQFCTPPDLFRDIPTVPITSDLLENRSVFLRPNIVQGAYRDVEHYLDVQFRLLREDFIRPLRDGIKEYIRKKSESASPSGKVRRIRVNNIKIYSEVLFEEAEICEDKLGFCICFDPKEKFCESINWEQSKRFMLGSLLILTRDDFESILLAKVLKRNDKALKKGRLLIELLLEEREINIYNKSWLMAESSLFFGSYSHVLEALKRYDEVSFPLTDYIVKGKTGPEVPPYLLQAEAPLYKLLLPEKEEIRLTRLIDRLDTDERIRLEINPLDDNMWPTAEVLGLDETQFEALKGALTQKVMLIQGPPGTGKTYLGLKIGAVLLENHSFWQNSGEYGLRPLVVVCYTNHALDQFLTGLMPFTDSIVRVGGGSKEKILEQFSIKNRRSNYRPGRNLYHMVKDAKWEFSELKDRFDSIRKISAKIQNNCGIVDPESLLCYGVLTAYDLHSFDSIDDFIEWLEGGFKMKAYHRQLGQCLSGDIYDNGDIVERIKKNDQNNVYFIISFSKIDEMKRKCSEDIAMYYVQKEAYLKHNLVSPLTKPELLDLKKVNHLRSIKQLKVEQRWQLYRFWIAELLKILRESEIKLQPQLLQAASKLKQARLVEEQDVMAGCRVIGMTTSYAASRQSILKQLRPRIVIVEEAAEILEAHVIVSLTGSVEHLIMIGDHLQLRPNPAVFELATKYHLNVSFFERLINNKVQCVSLSTQHRMRPEVAKLICPAIYPFLINHESVLKYPSIRGVSHNMAFIDHTHPQEEVEEIQSFRNIHEAKFISAMVRYLRLQGYEASKITVLATYKGQMFYLTKLRQENPFMDEVRITVVDNYQGEENDIILLSLVRSNESGDVGFLKTENRVCVALSRAKHGLFIFGNMQNMVAKGAIWPKILKELKDQNSLVESLELRCEVHSTLTLVSCADDFRKVPEGGCLHPCGTLMSCGHTCEQVCHASDRDHKKFKCFELCTRPVCVFNHICPLKCFENCEPCIVPKNVSLPCGHPTEIPCHIDPLEYKCLEVVPCMLICNHLKDVLCHQSKKLEDIKCLEPCPKRLDCGHACLKTCHLMDDPNHENYLCTKPCIETNRGCSTGEHFCKKLCHQDCEMCSVMVQKELPCSHKWTMQCHEEPSRKFCGNKCKVVNECGHKCTKTCKEDCSPCRKKVEKVIPICGHKQLMDCGTDPTFFKLCKADCDRFLSCGHSCTKLCHEDCVTDCQAKVPYPSATGCGHTIQVPCSMKHKLDPFSRELLDLCQEPCNFLLQPCNHRCKGTCGKCFQGRLHRACQEPCGRVLVCGHSCKAPCAEKCPPCGEPCTLKCQHSKCPRKCGDPCAPCKEPCLRKCPHQKCPRRCGDKCNVVACQKPCEKTLKKCKHKCVGLCGDTCVCEECNPGIRDVFFGAEDEEGARFIILPDCKQKHIFEVSGLQKWLLQGDEIKEKVCPNCSIPIRTCLRFNEIIMAHAFDVQAVKRKVFGSAKNVFSAGHTAWETLNGLTPFPIDMTECKILLNLLLRTLEPLLKGARNHHNYKAWFVPPLSRSEVSNLLEYSKILSTLNNLSKKSFGTSFKGGISTKLLLVQRLQGTSTGSDETSHKLNTKCQAEVKSSIEKLAKNLRTRNVLRLSHQEAKDIAGVMNGLDILVQLCFIESSPNFSLLKPSSRQTWDIISERVRGFHPYTESDYAQDRKNLAIIAKEVKCVITQTEIRKIVAAMGMSQGHWFKCPNGHVYAIGDCGGATIESKCNECGAKIGGGNHRLRSDNMLAPEMDGATRPAWPGSTL